MGHGHLHGPQRGLGHGHGHGHGFGTAAGIHRTRLIICAINSATVLVAELIGAYVTGSLVLLADAGHLATDFVGIAIALVAVTLAQRAPTARRTFGWQRLEILAAAANGLLLIGVATYVLWEAITRFGAPPRIESGAMLVIGALGLVANLISLLLLRPGQAESLNLRGAYLEVLGDLLTSVAVVVAAIVIALTGWHRADVVASIAVGLFIVPRAIVLLREAVHVLLEATPKDVDLDAVRAHILDVGGVIDVHDLHAWTITSGQAVLSAHVVVDDETFETGGGCRVLDELRHCLAHHYDVEHSTFQLESPHHRAHEHAFHD